MTSVKTASDEGGIARRDPRTAVRVVSTVVRHEVFVVALLLVGLEMLMYSGHFSGRLTPPWDFLGTYNAEAFAWWRDGSFVSPTQWMPYQWGGYPAAASIQNSAWYLPVGILAWVAPFTIYAASVLHALHVGWGALGVYCLVRRFGVRRTPAILGLVAYFFAVGFYSNAQHVDISRAFAWAPWILLCTSSVWFWRRWWGVPLAGLVFWQAAISSYPGVLVQLAYAVLAWVVVNQAVQRPRPRLREYVGPLMVASTGAVLLCVVKFLPALLTRGTAGSPLMRVDVFDLGVVGTLFYQYDLDFLGNDVTMRSFFVVAPMIPLALLARLAQPLVRSALVVLATGIVLGVPGPWSPVVDKLPGMDLSRFQLADSRVLVVLGCVLLAAAGLDRLIPRDGVERWVVSGRTLLPADGLRRRREIAVCCVPLVALAVGVGADFPETAWAVPWTILAMTTLVLLMLVRLPEVVHGDLREVARGLTVTVVLLALASGAHWAHVNLRTWQVEREEYELFQWRATSGSLVLHRAPVRDLPQRPAREPLPDAVDDALARSNAWSSGFYSGLPTLGGYANLVGVPSYDAIYGSVITHPFGLENAPDPAAEVPKTPAEAAAAADVVNAQAFWTAPGVVMAASPSKTPSADAVQRCVESGACGDGLVAQPTGYDLDTWTYEVTAAAETAVVLNEAHYPGFRLEACSGEQCEELAVSRHSSGAVTAQLPAGTWDLTLVYSTPGQETGWRAFLAGLVVLAAWPFVRGVSASVRRSRRRAAPRGTRRSP